MSGLWCLVGRGQCQHAFSLHWGLQVQLGLAWMRDGGAACCDTGLLWGEDQRALFSACPWQGVTLLAHL